MKFCAEKQKLIAALVLDLLEAGPERELRAHLANCAGCREYLAELMLVTEQLAAAEPTTELKATEGFHHQLLAKLEPKAPASVGAAIEAFLRASAGKWRVAYPVVVLGPVLVILVAIITVTKQWPNAGLPNHPIVPAVPVNPAVMAVVNENVAPAPTLANYERVASEAPDKLDDLLVRQEQPAARATPVYTAAARALSF